MLPSPDWPIIWIVILVRLTLPLFLPKYPLPAILGCLVVDSVDQTLFESFTQLNLDWYQNYDKALDIFYLGIAYLSMLRNWRSQPAFQVGRFLFYYRLVGVVIFELIDSRPVLFFFPNTFEYFFIYHEALRARWNPLRFSAKYWSAVAAAIWLFIKLPQEWWIHIAQLDVTDVVKEKLFGVSVDAGTAAAITNRPLALVVLMVPVVLLVLAVRFLLVPRLPEPHHPWRFTADRLPKRADTPEERREVFALTRRPIDVALLEKVFLVTLVTLIFAQIMPNFHGTNLQLATAVTVVVTLNSFVSYWFARQGLGWRSALAQFVTLMAINASIVGGAQLLFGDGPLSVVGPGAFLLALLTLLITLYDYFRPVYSARFETRGRGAANARAG